MSVRTRRERLTKSLVSTGTAEEMGLDPAGGKWCAVCEDHGSILNTSTRKLADWHASAPEGWCEGCRKKVEKDS